MELARSGVRPTSIMQKRKWNSARGIVKVRESGERKFRPGNITELSQSMFSFSSLGKIRQCFGLLTLRTMHLCESVGLSLFCLLSFIVKSNITICMYNVHLKKIEWAFNFPLNKKKKESFIRTWELLWSLKEKCGICIDFFFAIVHKHMFSLLMYLMY